MTSLRCRGKRRATFNCRSAWQPSRKSDNTPPAPTTTVRTWNEGTSMSTTGVDAFIHRLARGMAAERLAGQSDRQLVERLLVNSDEAVFEALVRRHGSMV